MKVSGHLTGPQPSDSGSNRDRIITHSYKLEVVQASAIRYDLFTIHLVTRERLKIMSLIALFMCCSAICVTIKCDNQLAALHSDTDLPLSRDALNARFKTRTRSSTWLPTDDLLSDPKGVHFKATSRD